MYVIADLGMLVAETLQSPPAVNETIDVVGPAYSERTIAELLGKALGRELEVATVPEEAWAGAISEAGFRPHIAESLAELYRADEHGLLAPRGDRSVHVNTPVETTIERVLALR